MSILRLLRGAFLCLLSFATAAATAAASRTPDALALTRALDARGHLRLPAGYIGALDAQGYRLRVDADGPAFVAGTGPTGWQTVGGLPDGCDGRVLALARLANGDVVAAGRFHSCGGTPATHIARWDGQQWHALGSPGQEGLTGVLPGVHALAVIGGDLYVGGFFDRAGDVAAQNIARWDGQSWHALGAGMDNGVMSLHVWGNTLVAGGYFLQPARRVAQWTGGQWLPFGQGLGGVSDSVEALGEYNGLLVAGGTFRSSGSSTVRYLAYWQSISSTWQEFPGGVDGVVLALANTPDGLVIGGDFRRTAGQLRPRLARYGAQGWASLSNGAGPDGYITALSWDGTALYVGGDFRAIDGAPYASVARWSAGLWSALGPGLESTGNNAPVYTLLATPAGVYAGGGLSSAGPQSVQYVGHWDGGAWRALGANPGQGVNDYVYAVAARGEEIYIAGYFSYAGSERANRVARWDGQSWSSLGEGAANGLDGVVYSLAVSADRVYAGGRFQRAGLGEARNIAQWDGVQWSALGSGPDNGVNAPVTALVLHGNDLYVGGEFDNAGGLPAAAVARWDGTAWQPLGGGITGIDRTITQLLWFQDQLVVAGQFSTAGGISAPNLARWNGNSWSRFDALAPGGLVRAIAGDGDTLYVGGDFSQVGSLAAPRLARWQSGTWQAFASPGSEGDYVLALALHRGRLYASRLHFTNDRREARIEHWDGAAWTVLGAPDTFTSEASVDALHAGAGVLTAVGAFQTVEGRPSTGFAQWRADALLRDGFDD